jgi:hypothetical protein
MMMFAEMYMNNLTKDQFNGMALENGISLSKFPEFVSCERRELFFYMNCVEKSSL